MQESFSIVIPCFNEEAYIDTLLKDLQKEFKDLKMLEIILVDDGSTKNLQNFINTPTDLDVKVLRNEVNQGQTMSLKVGIEKSNYDLIGILDADGQNPPNELRKMYDILIHDSLDAVIGFRKNRQDTLIKTIPSKIANIFFRLITKSKIKDLGCSLKVVRKSYLSAIKLDGDLHRFIGPMLEKRNLKLKQVPTLHKKRTTGKTNYGLKRTIPVVIDSLYFFFTNGFQTPKRYILGKISFYFIVCFVSLIGIVLYQKISFGVFVHRNPLFLISVVFLLASIQIFFSSFDTK